MKKKRYSKELKAKVALAALKGHQTANEIASEFGVHEEHKMLYSWEIHDPRLCTTNAGENFQKDQYDFKWDSYRIKVNYHP